MRLPPPGTALPGGRGYGASSTPSLLSRPQQPRRVPAQSQRFVLWAEQHRSSCCERKATLGLPVKPPGSRPEKPKGVLGFLPCVSETRPAGKCERDYVDSVPRSLPRRRDETPSQLLGILTHLCSAGVLHPDGGPAVRQPLLSSPAVGNTPQARGEQGTEPWSSTRGPQLRNSAQPKAEAGAAAAQKAGAELTGVRQSHLNLTGASSARAARCSGSHRMWISTCGDIWPSPFTHLFFPQFQF